MKRIWTRACAVLLTGALLCGCNSVPSAYPHEDHSKEVLQEAYTHKNDAGELEYDYYYAYNSNGEVMFSLREYAYDIAGYNGIVTINWYTESTLQSSSYIYPKADYLLVADVVYNSEKYETRNDTLLLYDGTLQYLSVKEFEYSADKLTSTDTSKYYTTTSQNTPVTTHSKYDAKGNLIEEYAMDSNGKEYLAAKSEYTMSGELKKRLSYTYDSAGNVTEVAVTEYTYDSEDRILTYKNYNEATGEVIGSTTYTRVLNADGTVASQNTKNDLTEKTTTNVYYYSKLSEKTYSEGYVGYWQCTVDDYQYFLMISANGLICVGNFDQNFGMMVPQVYGFYEMQENGTMICELYDNACVQPDDYLAGTLYLQDGKLIYNTFTFEKVTY